jgi:hypothetical protein
MEKGDGGMYSLPLSSVTDFCWTRPSPPSHHRPQRCSRGSRSVVAATAHDAVVAVVAGAGSAASQLVGHH